MMQDRERAMREATLEAEERAALMEIRLREFEEKTRQNTEAAEKQQEAMLQNVQNAVNAAASAINMDPDLVNVAMGSPPGTDRLSARNTGRMGRTPRRYTHTITHIITTSNFILSHLSNTHSCILSNSPLNSSITLSYSLSPLNDFLSVAEKSLVRGGDFHPRHPPVAPHVTLYHQIPPASN